MGDGRTEKGGEKLQCSFTCACKKMIDQVVMLEINKNKNIEASSMGHEGMQFAVCII